MLSSLLSKSQAPIRSMHASPKLNAIDRNRRALPCTMLSQSQCQTKGAFFCVPTEPV
jgi:hypothetical protein